MKNNFNTIESVVADLRKGRMVIVVDDADRENEGDLILSNFSSPAATIEDSSDKTFAGQKAAR